MKDKYRFLGPPSRGFPKFDLEAYIAWNRRQETASLDEVELKIATEAVGDLELEWFDFSIRPKEKSARRKKIESLLNKVGL